MKNSEPEPFPFPLGPRGRVLGEAYDRRLRDDPLGEVQLPSGDVARLAVRYEDSAQIMTDPRFTKELSYPGAPKMYPGVDIVADPRVLFNLDPPRHTRLRRLMSGGFAKRKVAGWRPRIRAMAYAMIDGLGGPEADFVSEVAFPYAIRVICEVMDVDEIDTERMEVWADNLLPSAGHPMEEQLATLQEVAGYLAEVIAAHRANPGDGVLGTLIQARDEGDQLTEEELIANTMGLIVAGHETTASVLSRSLLRLLDPRAGYDGLVARPELIPGTVEELLRLEVPGDGSALRVATEDIALPSGRICKGEAVLASFVGPNNDPTVYADPTRLNPEQPGPPHLTFGRGAHFCLGAELARIGIQEIISVLTERLPRLALAVSPDDILWTTYAFRRPVRLPLRLG